GGEPLASEIQSLARQLVRLDIFTPHRVLAFVEARSNLMDQIPSHQFEDDKLRAIQDKVRRLIVLNTLFTRERLAPCVTSRVSAYLPPYLVSEPDRPLRREEQGFA
ncbi:hypothetical protein MTR67_043410, partial [Solanum verrucosum]